MTGESQKKNLIVALHGFLGEPSDWNLLHDLGDKNDFLFPNLWQEEQLTATSNFDVWTKRFQLYLETHQADQYENRILCAYSMGGRLAAHHLVQNPGFWSSAFLVSTNPGLESSEEKIKRLQNDRVWAQRFSQWDWNEVLREWNSQSVFQGVAVEPERIESRFPKERLVGALTHWSLGFQENLRRKIPTTAQRIICLTGEKDTKFTTLTEEWTQDTPIEHLISSASGHRLLFDDPNFLFRNIELHLQKFYRL
ncbi:MAG: alpha/beta fold hydrolase [Pseudobdellovibrionaceae bacterium]